MCVCVCVCVCVCACVYVYMCFAFFCGELEKYLKEGNGQLGHALQSCITKFNLTNLPHVSDFCRLCFIRPCSRPGGCDVAGFTC